MRYIHSFDLPLDLVPEGFTLRWGYFFPILGGDESYIEELGDEIHIADLIPMLSEGDVLCGDADIIDWIEAEYPSPYWERRQSYWVGDEILEYLPG